MKKLSIGSLSDLFSKPLPVILIFVQFAVLIFIASGYHARNGDSGCLYCHADKARMLAAGYPQYYMTAEEVEKETKMPGAGCTDCHLGNGASHNKSTAHKGMLKALVIDNNAHIIPRKGVGLKSLIPTGTNRMYALFPKTDGQPNPDVFTVLWHDRDKKTLGFDPNIAEETCGRRGCHPLEVKQFKKTIMGGNVRQRSTHFWTDIHGPNNCGPSFADMPPGAGAGFSTANYKLVKAETSCPSSYGNATDRQRFCNVCHAGCIDCHYYPTVSGGVHNFTRKVPAVNCTGGGLGTGMCHSGSQERRRGDSYLGAEFSQPPGFPPDAHVKAGMQCIDCHENGGKGMGDISRKVDCGGCHYTAWKANLQGPHRNLSCQACHISKLGGYQMTVWGKGNIAGKPSPFMKYSLYYGVFSPPILIKDMEGMYTPYKVWPNIATNFKGNAAPSGLKWRWPGGQTQDAYAIMGAYSSLPGANRALAWMQFEAVGHGIGKSRTCRSCHESDAQKASASWEYLEYAGSEPFTGAQNIILDKKGIRITDIHETSKPRPLGDANPWDYAAWKYLKNIWSVPGDFSIPRPDKAKYRKYMDELRRDEGKLKNAEARLSKLDKKSVEYRELASQIKRTRESFYHNPAEY
ncbi:MAG: cytochrome c3 family protein [Nitrospirota bacterium]